MILEHYIITLDFIEQHCNEVIGEWDGDSGGLEEERADIAKECLEHVESIKELIKDL
jgi:hypothetical protein